MYFSFSPPAAAALICIFHWSFFVPIILPPPSTNYSIQLLFFISSQFNLLLLSILFLQTNWAHLCREKAESGLTEIGFVWRQRKRKGRLPKNETTPEPFLPPFSSSYFSHPNGEHSKWEEMEPKIIPQRQFTSNLASSSSDSKSRQCYYPLRTLIPSIVLIILLNQIGQ